MNCVPSLYQGFPKLLPKFPLDRNRPSHLNTIKRKTTNQIFGDIPFNLFTTPDRKQFQSLSHNVRVCVGLCLCVSVSFP